VAIEGFELVVRPTAAPAPRDAKTPADAKAPPDAKAPVDGAAPKSLYLATGRELYRVSLPEDGWSGDAGRAYTVKLPKAVHTDCVALVLEEAYGGQSKPVGLAELRAITSLGRESGKLEELVKRLDDDGAKGDAAAALLLRGGPNAIGATLAGYASLGTRGKQRALDVVDGGDCHQTVSFWVDRLLGRGRADRFDPEEDPVAKRAKKALRQCRRDARKALARVVQTEEPGPAQIIAARELALVGPEAALDAVLTVLDKGPTEVRRELRHTITTAAQQNSGRTAASALLEPARFAKLPLVTRIDLLRGLSPAVGDTPGAGAALAQVLASDSSFRTRYLLQLPAGEFARAGDARALAFVKQSLSSDASQHVRGQAARAAARTQALLPTLAAALNDRAPRVRQAALEALSESPGEIDGAAEQRIVGLLAADPWTFVRVGAAAALSKRAPRPSTNRALLAALEDKAPDVRRAVLRSIGARGSRELAEQVFEVADNAREATRVRAMAVHTLAALCHRSSAPLLVKLALRAGAPQLPYDEPLGLASLAALAKLKPAGLEQALAPLLLGKRIPPHVRQAARAALRSQGSCGTPSRAATGPRRHQAASTEPVRAATLGGA
jgi:HEAT repeat protein